MNQCLSALSIDISGDCFSNNNGEDHACSGHHLPTVSIVSNENEATTLASHMMEEDDISNEELSEEEPKFDVKPCDRELNESEEVIQLFDEQLKSFDGDVDFIANVQFPRTFVFVHESKQSETIQTTQKLAVFQKSLFKNVQPTIYFGLEGEESTDCRLNPAEPFVN